jgi:hypothetical protein
MGGLPSQLTAAALSTVVILGIKALVSLEVFALTDDQINAVETFVVAAVSLGFGVMLWYVNRTNPNPTAPTNPNPIPPPPPPIP